MARSIRRTIAAVLVVVLAAALALPGCGGDSADVAVDSAPVSSPTSEPTVEPTATPDLTPTTTPEPAPTPEQSPTPAPPETPIVLAADGLGVVSFGDAAQDVVHELTTILGPADHDQEMQWPDEPVFIHNGYPVQHFYRQIGWDSAGLEVILSDGVVWPDQRSDTVLISWSCFGQSRSVRLQTEQGITLGSTVPDLESAYGDNIGLLEPDEGHQAWHVALPGEPIEGTGPILAGVIAYLDGDPTDSATVVSGLMAGALQAP